MFRHQLRVLYADTDTAGIVYHGNYLRYFEAARGELMRAGGISYAEVERRGLLWPVVETHLRHRRPARYDELLDVIVGITTLGAAQVSFRGEIRQAESGLLLCESSIRLGCVNKNSKPVRIPHDIRSQLERFRWEE